MSGQPYKVPMDVSTAREAYLSNLKLRAELDDKNLQANKVFIKTGQLPVEPTDTRNLTEKIADVERLKIDLRSKLLSITDGLNANKIVESLSPDQLTFLAQNFSPIQEQMKRMYSLGVLAEIFVDFLRKYIEKFNITKGVELGLQQSSANQLLANQRIIMQNMASKRDIQEINDAIDKYSLQNTNLGKSIKQNLEQLQDVIDYLPETFAELNKADNAIQRAQLIEVVNNIVKELPTSQSIDELLKQLVIMARSRDRGGLIQILEKIDELTSSGLDLDEEIAILRKIVDSNRPIEVEALASATASGEEVQRATPINIPKGQVLLMSSTDVNFNQGDNPRAQGKSKDQMVAYITNMFKYVKAEYAPEDPTNPRYRTLIGFMEDFTGSRKSNLSAYNVGQLKSATAEMNGLLVAKGYQVPMGGLGIRKMQGKGVAVARSRPSEVLVEDIDYTHGIQPSAKFVPLGRYLINKRQLDKDIVAIKRPAGSTIPNLPSQRVSRNFGSVMRKIVGGSLPSYDELSSLTDDERVYLHKVARETRIDDKISIPTPKKDEDEKDINQFEILKGQILAGNDNLDVVKKFKAIILKLSRKELIPKAQVKDLLLDLATLGH